jgi:uncharacterized protein YjiS (DUF1127 family)
MLRTLSPKPIDDLRHYLAPTRGGSRWTAWRWIVAGVQGVVSFSAKRRRLLQAERDLHRLDDRMLKDIGIDRGEITRVVWRGRRRR